ncbi:MAG: DUF1461 domain-containing protein [Nanoarchaeota archaeon]
MLQIKTIIAIVLIPIMVFLFSFFTLLSDISFYNKVLVNNEINTTVGFEMSKDLIKYFGDYSDFKPGIKYLNDEENIHMQEVKRVINKVKLVFVASILLFLILVVSAKETNKIFFYGGILTILLPIIIYLIPFEVLFVLFHKISFVGKWQFPLESIMIQTFPQQFFYDFAFWIFVRGLVFGAVLAGLNKVDLLFSIFSTKKS